MAVVVEFVVPGASPEQLYAVEELTQERGLAAGGPPYDGCLFFAVVPSDDGVRVSSAWRREADFRGVHDTMLGPDLASVGLEAADVRISTVLSMSIPGAH